MPWTHNRTKLHIKLARQTRWGTRCRWNIRVSKSCSGRQMRRTDSRTNVALLAATETVWLRNAQSTGTHISQKILRLRDLDLRLGLEHPIRMAALPPLTASNPRENNLAKLLFKIQFVQTTIAAITLHTRRIATITPVNVEIDSDRVCMENIIITS